MSNTSNDYTITLATEDSVGEWDGRESEAAAAFNRVLEREAELFTGTQEEWEQHEKHLWDIWGADCDLLNQ